MVKQEFEQAVKESLIDVFYEFNGKKGCNFNENDLQEAVKKFINSRFFEDNNDEE